jgi:hypothetical protein
MDRKLHGPSAESRLAAVVRELIVRMQKPYPHVPDLADFRDELRPFVQRELLMARIEELQRYGTFSHVMELQKELDAANSEIAKRNSQ